eukprot:TRINITY_DN4612_c0_g1_i1.p1 TRINITY_DN4612_c0_g1~~TRINITY_DN4612_c0_g1_i1.p1  ORF type:complete len:209 (+),score=26.40 TRINITY_DN4612_c0_g1_i1:141-767(+)
MATIVKVLMLGDSNVGKTSTLAQYVTNSFQKRYKATIGADFMTKHIIVNDKLYTLQIWDTAGQERFRSLSGNFYRHAACCVLVYDVTNRVSFENLAMWHTEFYGNGSPELPEKFPFVLVGNKVDVDSDERQVSTKDAEEWIKERNIEYYFECSAKEAINVDQLFQAAAEMGVAYMNEVDSIQGDDMIDDKSNVNLEQKQSDDDEKCSC